MLAYKGCLFRDSGTPVVQLFPFLHFPVLKTQNHRMVGVGRDLCGSSSVHALLKQVHLEQVAQSLVQEGF